MDTYMIKMRKFEVESYEERIDFLQKEIDLLRSSLHLRKNTKLEEIKNREQVQNEIKNLIENYDYQKEDRIENDDYQKEDRVNEWDQMEDKHKELKTMHPMENEWEMDIMHLKLCKSRKKCARLKLKIEELKTIIQELEMKEINNTKYRNHINIDRNGDNCMKDNKNIEELCTLACSREQEKSYDNLHLTISQWKRQMDELPKLHAMLRNLRMCILPHTEMEKECKKNESVFELKEYIKSMTLSYTTHNKDTNIKDLDLDLDLEDVTTLRMLVEHFMKLFDVRKITSVYTRMHDVYARYNEDQNAFRSIREVLHLSKTTSNHAIVEIVGKLAKAKHLLKVKHLDRVIRQVETYDQFYVTFQKLVKDMMYLLAVDSIDLILPSLKVLLHVPT